MKRLIVVAIVASAAMPIAQSGRQTSIDWPHWGADLGQTKYSAASQITRGNVNKLEVAWRWENDEKAIPEFERGPAACRHADHDRRRPVHQHRLPRVSPLPPRRQADLGVRSEDVRRRSADRGARQPPRCDVLAHGDDTRISHQRTQQAFAVTPGRGSR